MALEVFHDPDDDELADKRLTGLIGYWRSLCCEGRLPGRKQVDPLDIPAILPWVFLIDTQALGGFRYRLCGTRIVQDMGYDLTGQLVSRAYAGPDWVEVRKDYDYVIRNGSPCMTINRVTLKQPTRHYAYRRLLLPLSENGREVNMLMGAAVPEADLQRD